MAKTNKPLTITMNCGVMPYDVQVPAGQRVRPIPGEQGMYWVEDLASFLMPRSIAMHDATHYGLRVKAEDVEP